MKETNKREFFEEGSVKNVWVSATIFNSLHHFDIKFINKSACRSSRRPAAHIPTKVILASNS